ncbi:MAG: hypothetical protein QW201_02845, partial [Thermoproteota archaeon]
MKPRERVIATITLDKPDRAPILHSPLPCALLKYGEEINKIFTRYPQDFGPSKFDIPKKEDLPPDYRKGIHKDEWGTFWISSADGIHGQVYDYPIKNWEDLDEYEFPPLPDRSSNYYIQELTNMKTKVLSLKNAGYCAMLGWKPGNFFERMQWLRGFKNLF